MKKLKNNLINNLIYKMKKISKTTKRWIKIIII